jgi:hypothetical protein
MVRGVYFKIYVIRVKGTRNSEPLYSIKAHPENSLVKIFKKL